MTVLIDMTGQRFGRWTVETRAGNKWHCRCDCGKTGDVGGVQLRTGRSLSCGCLRAEQLTRHGHARKNGQRTPTYRAWYAMIQRTTNPRFKQYADYGGRGIGVCDEWRDFAQFLADMGERPEGLTLDRIDNNRGYSADNCRWASRSEQQLNRRCNRMISVGSITKPLTAWARETGIKAETLRSRLRSGWPTDRAVDPKVTVT